MCPIEGPLEFINCSLLLVLACNMLKFRHADGEAFSVVRFLSSPHTINIVFVFTAS